MKVSDEMKWWETPIEVKQEEQERNGITKRRIRLKAANWTVDVFPSGDSWSVNDPTIVIDDWNRMDIFNARLLMRMLKDALNYSDWGGVVESPSLDEILALAPPLAEPVVAENARTDADFEAALDEFWEAMRAAMFTRDDPDDDRVREENAQSARRAVLDLHRAAIEQARSEVLGDLRGWVNDGDAEHFIVWYDERGGEEVSIKVDDLNAKIDALRKGDA